MKLIGVDYGRRRMGLAVTDETGSVVRGLLTIDRKKCRDCRAEITALVEKEKADALVFGLPFGSDEGETLMSAEVREFAGQFHPLPVHFVDESMTSKKAGELLRFRKKKVRKDKSINDRIAACLILEEFLREQKPAIAP
jgi:putative holliday junction resolvase